MVLRDGMLSMQRGNVNGCRVLNSHGNLSVHINVPDAFVLGEQPFYTGVVEGILELVQGSLVLGDLDDPFKVGGHDDWIL